MTSEDDIRFMRQALGMARRGLGRTWPNPSVGCVIVKNGSVIAQARTADGGRPHAEVLALQDVGKSAKGATLYVTLEPCSHHGKTPPCVGAIIDAEPSRVVIGTQDINPQVNGKGIEALRVAGIDVKVGVLEQECRDVTAGFFKRIQENRPFVTLKIACSLDGRVAVGNGTTQWITGEPARRHVHGLRARHDAIMVGIGTVQADDPLLTTRVDGIVHKPVRIVLDSNLQTSADSRLVKTANDIPLWVFHSNKEKAKEVSLSQFGVRLFNMQNKALQPVLAKLAEEGLTGVLVEGGPAVLNSFLQEGLWDELHIYRAPCMLGEAGKPAFGALRLEHIALKRLKMQVLGQDLLEIYARKG
jgi:diaminohydroxyphosphoribosylaminopyrimidine deaminase/5-amino-6-(5-phosphoribosylamino)uracil reductase